MRWLIVFALAACSEGQTLETSPQAREDREVGDTGAPDEPEWAPEWGDDEREVFRLVNVSRMVLQVCGSERMGAVPQLRWNDQLRDAARAHSRHMARRGFFDHVAPNGSTPADRAEDAGYPTRSVGENIAAGQPTPSSVMESWMDSPGHCRNIMDGGYTELGVGLYVHEGAPFWTQVFGSAP